jgi:hypothetical protein
VGISISGTTLIDHPTGKTVQEKERKLRLIEGMACITPCTQTSQLSTSTTKKAGGR